jgi:hypothetical protein
VIATKPLVPDRTRATLLVAWSQASICGSWPITVLWFSCAGEANICQVNRMHFGTEVGGERVNQELTTRRAPQVSTTILPPALFSSMHRCASTISSKRKTLPTCTRRVPDAICAAKSSMGVRMKSSDSPA